MNLRFIFAVFCLLFIPMAASADNKITRVSDIRFGSSEQGHLRVVLALDSPVEFRHFAIEEGAPRVVLDMPRVRWSINGMTAETGDGSGSGFVSYYRFEHNTAQTSRLILNLESAAKVISAFALGPGPGQDTYRIVLDLEKINSPKTSFAAAGPVGPSMKPAQLRQTAQSGPAQVDKVEATVLQLPLIMIDPGHGGKDPGAIGKSGLQEKRVNLLAAQTLAKALEETGRYKVSLTRDDDTFIELEDRVKIARESNADLFISIHADAGKSSKTRGASVYTLSNSGAKRSKTMRKAQDWVLDFEVESQRADDINEILVDLTEHETKNQSARFAKMLIPEIEKAGWPTLDNTHRNAGFFVLLAPDVPAVLLEMGFLTNHRDEKLLSSSKHRDHLVAAIVKSIDSFFVGQQLHVAQR